jgi:hypothetical protein
MTWLFITLPIMLVAIGIATVPVLYYSIREHQRIHGRHVARPRTKATKPIPSDYRTRSVSHQDIRARYEEREMADRPPTPERTPA